MLGKLFTRQTGSELRIQNSVALNQGIDFVSVITVVRKCGKDLRQPQVRMSMQKTAAESVRTFGTDAAEPDPSPHVELTLQELLGCPPLIFIDGVRARLDVNGYEFCS